MKRERTSDFLATVIEKKRRQIASLKKERPVSLLDKMALDRNPRNFKSALLNRTPAIIAETKKASPSAGIIVPDYDPAQIAALYERGGAAAISVLTEDEYFMGRIEDLKLVRDAVSLPLLRKDFICNIYQIHEAAAFGADVVLLIAAALTPEEMAMLYKEAVSLNLDVIIETHSVQEIKEALKFEQAIIGVNSRNLKTLKTDISIALNLASCIPGDRLYIAESGIKTADDIQKLLKVGYKGFLIGESLLRSHDIISALSSFLNIA